MGEQASIFPTLERSAEFSQDLLKVRSLRLRLGYRTCALFLASRLAPREAELHILRLPNCHLSQVVKSQGLFPLPGVGAWGQEERLNHSNRVNS